MSELKNTLLQPELPAPHEELVLPSGEQAAEPDHTQAETARQTQIEASRQVIEQEAKTSESVKENAVEAPAMEPQHIHKELKDTAYQQLLVRTRKRLPAVARPLSKFVHQPVVEAVSQAAEKTIARPSGLLAGALTAFIGSSIFLYASKKYGFTYNFLLFAVLFVGGFALGLVIELLIRLRKPGMRA